MKGGISKLLRGLSVSRRSLLILAVAVCLVVPKASAGVGDILALFKTITSTLQGAIGGALTEMQSVHAAVNNFRQQVVWPVQKINQARAFANSTRSQYGKLMSGITMMRNNSAALTNPSQLESIYRSGQAGSIVQLQPVFGRVYGAVPAPAAAHPELRNMVDMDDALAMGSLKTTIVADQTAQSMLVLADSLEQQSATAAPGSGTMLSAQAQVANLETQAYLAKVLAAELRQEAARLAHQNALLKASAGTVRNLQNQIQRVLSHP